MSRMSHEQGGAVELASAPPASDKAQGASLFKKTKMCAFNIQGRCLRGSACAFAHHEEELKAKPDFSLTSLCKTLCSTGRCDNPECKFAHSRMELKPRVNMAAQPHATSWSHVVETKRKASTTRCDSSGIYSISTQQVPVAMAAAPVLHTPYLFERHLHDSVHRSEAATAADYEHKDLQHSPLNRSMYKMWPEHGAADETFSSRTTSGSGNDMHIDEETRGNSMVDSDVDNQINVRGSSPVDAQESHMEPPQQGELGLSLLIKALDLRMELSVNVRPGTTYVFDYGISARAKNSFLHFDESEVSDFEE